VTYTYTDGEKANEGHYRPRPTPDGRFHGVPSIDLTSLAARSSRPVTRRVFTLEPVW